MRKQKKQTSKNQKTKLLKKKNCITEMTEKIRKQNVNKLIKNRFFIKKTRAADKKKLIIFSENASFLSTFFFLELRDLERMKKITII